MFKSIIPLVVECEMKKDDEKLIYVIHDKLGNAYFCFFFLFFNLIFIPLEKHVLVKGLCAKFPPKHFVIPK